MPWDVGVAVRRLTVPRLWRGEEGGQRLEQLLQLLEEWAKERERERQRERDREHQILHFFDYMYSSV